MFVPHLLIYSNLLTSAVSSLEQQCATRGDIGDHCDPTSLTDGYLHAPCRDGLSCYLAGPGFKCMPSADGCFAQALYDFSREDIGSRYASVNNEAEGILEGAGDDDGAEELLNSVVGDNGLLDRIKDVACDTKELVTSYMRRLQVCQSTAGFGKDMKLRATQGLGSKEEDDSSFVFMAGGSIDGTAGYVGASLAFGVAIELKAQPQVALYITACAGISIGWEASLGMSAALQFGGGFGATRGELS